MKRLQHRSTLFPYTTLFRSNAYVDENRKHLPIEFTLTGVEPIPWTPAHSHVMARLMAWEMNVSWWSELTYAWLDDQLPESTLQELFPAWEPHHPTMMDREQSSRLASLLAPMVEKDFALRQLKIGRASCRERERVLRHVK